jgi:hypothetical protein
MIMKRTWDSKKEIVTRRGVMPKYTYTGWFLFGIIPLYIVRETNV